jgi:hypothetical protein
MLLFRNHATQLLHPKNLNPPEINVRVKGIPRKPP